jgi:hypothetical protein
MSSSRRAWEVPYPAQRDLEIARECVADAQVQLDLILVQLLIAGRGVAMRERAARSIGCSRRAIEIARTHLAEARAQLEPVLEAGPAASAEAEGCRHLEEGGVP